MKKFNPNLNNITTSDYREIYDINFHFQLGKFKQYTVQNICTFDTESSNGFKNPDTNECIGFDPVSYDRGILKTRNVPKRLYNYSDPDVAYMMKIDSYIPVSVTYIWQVAIEDGKGGVKLFIGRNWDDYIDFQRILVQELKRQVIFTSKCIDRDAENFYANKVASSHRVRLMIYTHNLGFDWQGLRSIFNDDFTGKRGRNTAVFARKARKPMKATMSLFGVKLEYRDTLSLAQMSLKNWAHTCPTCPIEKQEDFDYLTIKTPTDKLTPDEIKYALYDVLCLAFCIDYERSQYGCLENIPLTNTGKVRRIAREKVSKVNLAWAHRCAGITTHYTPEDFRNRVQLYQGGYCHACSLHVGKVLENETHDACKCFDFASSYPSALTNGKYVVEGYKPCSITEFNTLEKQDVEDPDYRWWAIIKLKGVRSKLAHSYWSFSKALDTKDVCVDNGRIHSAEEMTIYVTDLDWYTFNLAYVYDEKEVTYMEKGKADYLPKELILLLLDCFGKKTYYKGDDSKVVEYAMAKIVCNSIYGCMVFKMFSDEVVFNPDGWTKIEIDKFGDSMFKEIQKKINPLDEFGFFDIGLLCSAIARKRIWDFIAHFDDKVWYIDTDSIKGEFDDNDIKWIEQYNDGIKAREDKIANLLGFNPDLYAPKTSKGVAKRLGIMEQEPPCNLKTLGAKRYVAQHGDDFDCTIAGLPKDAGANKIKSFDDFTNETLWLTSESMKVCCYYNDNQGETIWYGRDGKKYTSYDKYGVCLKPVTFDLSMSDEFINFLEMLANGCIDKDNEFFDDTPSMLTVAMQ